MSFIVTRRPSLPAEEAKKRSSIPDVKGLEKLSRDEFGKLALLLTFHELRTLVGQSCALSEKLSPSVWRSIFVGDFPEYTSVDGRLPMSNASAASWISCYEQAVLWECFSGSPESRIECVAEFQHITPGNLSDGRYKLIPAPNTFFSYPIVLLPETDKAILMTKEAGDLFSVDFEFGFNVNKKTPDFYTRYTFQSIITAGKNAGKESETPTTVGRYGVASKRREVHLKEDGIVFCFSVDLEREIIELCAVQVFAPLLVVDYTMFMDYGLRLQALATQVPSMGKILNFMDKLQINGKKIQLPFWTERRSPDVKEYKIERKIEGEESTGLLSTEGNKYYIGDRSTGKNLCAQGHVFKAGFLERWITSKGTRGRICPLCT